MVSYDWIPDVSDVLAGRLISISPDTVGILSLQVSLDGITYSPSVTMGINQIPTIQDSDITVTIV
ncbi:hypothetical protein Y657_002369 [Salmonella enterica subsp. enterica]|nr:hypothetical protein [Salmonella enterica subsp. enterica]